VSFDPESLKHDLDQLPLAHRVPFAAACCEGLLPNYSVFARDVGWSSPDILRIAFDYVWTALEIGSMDRGKINHLIEQCDAIIPDTETSI
jgi:uncharacterized protein